jgi:nucleotide-binding universal stress UspA family protein
MLVAIDGSEYSDRAVQYLIRQAGLLKQQPVVHLLNVQLPLTGVNVKLFVSRDSLKSYYHDEGMAALDSARRKLDQAGLSYEYHIGVGDPGQVIADYAASKDCDHIVMGTHGRGAVSGALMGSVAQKVAHLAAVPVVLIR